MADNTRQASRTQDANEQRFQRLEELLADLSRQMADLTTSHRDTTSDNGDLSQAPGQSDSTMRPTLNQPHSNRPLKVDMPPFTGENPRGWLFKLDRYITYYRIPNDQKLPMVSMLMDGPALPWFQSLHNNFQLTSWESFTASLMDRFGPSPDRDLKGELTKLLQNQSSVQEYYNKFESLSTQLTDFPQSILQSCFESRLRREISREMRALQPTSLAHAL